MENRIVHGHHHDGIDRRGFLSCMAWVGTGVAWTVSGGVLTSRLFGQEASEDKKGGFTFVQISDSHIGFSKEPNKDVTRTLEQTVTRINALPARPELLIHTGDLTHLSKAQEFDTVSEVLKSAKVGQTFYAPGEHDVFSDDGKQYLERYGKGTRGLGWHSFDHKGVHFVGLVNVANLKPGGLGSLGSDQLDWLKKDVAGLAGSTPIVVFAHVPLWTVYEKWGWGTEDSAQALSYLKRFGSVTVLNGHIHQVMQKVEGNVPRADQERAGRQVAQPARPVPSQLHGKTRRSGHCGLDTGVTNRSCVPPFPGRPAVVYFKWPPASFHLERANDSQSNKDVTLSVAFKAVAGKNDQGGGFVWGYQDNNNYYIARMNPLEDNYRVYKVVAGKRTQLGTRRRSPTPRRTFRPPPERNGRVAEAVPRVVPVAAP